VAKRAEKESPVRKVAGRAVFVVLGLVAILAVVMAGQT